MTEQKTYILFDYYVEDYFQAMYLHDGFLFVRNQFANEEMLMPIDETLQKEILKYQRYAVINEDHDIIDWIKNEIKMVRGRVQ